jgi:glutamyl-tRNA reductase
LKVIRKLTKSIVNQMMQDPILRIKEMAGEKRADEAMDMFVKFFALEEQLDKARQAELKAEAESAVPAKKLNVQPQASATAALAPVPG